MATTSGNAANYRDLLTKLRDFLITVPGWSQIGGQTGAIAADADFVSLKATGLMGEDEIFMSLTPYSASTNNLYGLQLRGHTAYGTPGTTQPGGDSAWVYLPTLNSAVGYWVIANARRFILIVKTSARYDSMYGGFMLPEHLPDDWSYPLFIGASSPDNQTLASSDDIWHANYWNNCSRQGGSDNTIPSAGYLFSPIRSWVPVRNARNIGGAAYHDTGRLTLPWSRVQNQNLRWLLDDTPYVARGQIAGFYRATNDAPAAEMPERGVFYGSFDGVFYTPSFGASTEQEIVVDSKTYMLVPNVARTGDGHFAAILME